MNGATCYHVTAKSSNRKLGPMAVTTTGRQSCPDTCPLKKNGCYADGGPLAMHWNKVTDGTRGTALAEHCQAIAAAVSDGRMIRFNQAGDLPIESAPNSVKALLQAADKSTAAWTYTHHTARKGFVARLNRTVKATVNLSANTLEEVDTLSGHGSPVVCLLPIAAGQQPTVQYTADGRKVVTCPATVRDDVTCSTCGNGKPLCARKDRTYAIGFPVHGSSAKKASKVAS